MRERGLGAIEAGLANGDGLDAAGRIGRVDPHRDGAVPRGVACVDNERERVDGGRLCVETEPQLGGRAAEARAVGACRRGDARAVARGEGQLDPGSPGLLEDRAVVHQYSSAERSGARVGALE